MVAPADPFTGMVPFVMTAEARSFRAAAQKLGVTPSAISKSVAKLEKELGVRLLHRTSRSVTPTTEGELFLEKCREALDQAAAARELVAEAQRAPRGLLRVSLPVPLGRFLMPAIPRLLTRHPSLSLRVQLTDRFVRMTEENVDVAVRVGSVGDTRAVAWRLRSLSWATVAAPSYLARHGTPETPADLAKHNCLKFILTKGTEAPWVFRAKGRGADSTQLETIETRGTVSADDGEALVAAAVSGVGVLQAHDFMVAADLASGRLVEVLKEVAANGPHVTALAAPGRQGSPKVRAFVAFAREILA